eukprot:10701097-Ditylum_brightwellii.AAC.1
MIANRVLNTKTGKMMEYRDLLKSDKDMWLKSSANKFRRLAQGVGTCISKGTNTIFFIPKSKIPEGRKATYARLVVNV